MASPTSSDDFQFVSHEDVAADSLLHTSPLSEADISAIHRWLRPTKYNSIGSEFDRHLDAQAPDTGLWIRGTDSFQKWHTSDKCGAIWIKAVSDQAAGSPSILHTFVSRACLVLNGVQVAGAGKSVVAASAVDHFVKSEGAVVLYFFFRHIIESNKGPRALVQDFLAQLLPFSPLLQASLKMYVERREQIESVSLIMLWRHLLAGLRPLTRAYCVIDGLDEMDDHEGGFLTLLNDLGGFRPESVKVLLTSRPKQHLQSALRSPSVIHVSLERELVERDITTFLKHRLSSLSLPSNTRIELLRVISARSSGLFLAARLMVDQLLPELENPRSHPVDISKIVARIPTGLEEVYNAVLAEHASRTQSSRAIQVFLLGLVTHAARPMRLSELAEAVRLHYQQTRPLGEIKGLVRAACGPLLDILEDETVQILHHSLTEFLHDAQRSQRNLDDPSQFPVLDRNEAHRNIAECCLKCLTSGPLGPAGARYERIKEPNADNRPDSWKLGISLGHGHTTLRSGYCSTDTESPIARDDLQASRTLIEDEDFDYQQAKLHHAFLEYSVQHWPHHVRQSEDHSPEMKRLLDCFLIDRGLPMVRWLRLDHSKALDSNNERLLSTSPLHVAARFGLSATVVYLMTQNTDVDCLNASKWTPLHFSASNNWPELTSYLIDHGANIQADTIDGLSALHLAASKGHHAVAKILLEHGCPANIGKTCEGPGMRCGNAPRTVGHTPIRYAAWAGHRRVISTMVPYMTNRDREEAFAFAVRASHAAIVRDLLKSTTVSPNTVQDGDTMLYLAAENADLETIEALLDAGADTSLLSSARPFEQSMFSSSGSTGPASTPLHGLAQGDSTASRSVTFRDREKILQLLLKAGCDINARRALGQTPLWLVSKRRGADQGLLIESFLKAGADIDAVDEFGDTVLHAACARTDVESIDSLRVLLGAGLSPNIRRARDLQTPLHRCLQRPYRSNTAACKILLQHGADVNLQDKDGNTALHYATGSHSLEDVEYLIEAGANINVQNRDGCSPIFMVSKGGYDLRDYDVNIVHTLVKHGANLEARDRLGRTPLLNAAFQGNPLAITTLYEKGASARAVDLAGEGAFHLVFASSSGKTGGHLPGTWSALCKTDADPLAVDHVGHTILHKAAACTEDVSCQKTVESTFKYFTDARTVDHKSQTPIHCAVLAAKIINNQLRSHHAPFVDWLANAGIPFDIDAEDHDGQTALHRAAAVSVYHVALLLRHGADACRLAWDGRTALHIAAQNRQANALQLLLRHIDAAIVRAQDMDGRTALHEACSSGLPESVSLLIAHGADVNMVDNHGNTALNSCADFETVDTIWRAGKSPYHQGPKHCAGFANVTSQADQVLAATAANLTNKWGEIRNEMSTIRLRRIIELLVEAGADTVRDSNSLNSKNPFYVASSRRCSEMTFILQQMRDEHLIKKESIRQRVDHSFSTSSERLLKTEQDWVDALTKVDRDTKELYFDYRATILATRKPKVLKILQARGVSFTNEKFLGTYFCGDASILHHFSRWGIVELLAQIDRALVQTIEGPESILSIAKASRAGGVTVDTLLTEACEREVYNMDVIKLLVETMEVNVNNRSYSWRSRDDNVAAQGTVLHQLALMRQPWHLEAIEYLLAHGADVHARDDHGDTPLHIACGNSWRRGPDEAWGRDAVGALLRAGADVNALNDQGSTCMTAASKYPNVLKQLLDNGGDIMAGSEPLLVTVLRNVDVEALELVLEKDFDCNQVIERYPNDSRISSQTIRPLNYLLRTRLNPGRSQNERKYKAARLLIEYGADAMLPCSDEDTILHDALSQDDLSLLVIWLELKQGSFDINARDQRGRTILMAACDRKGSTARIGAHDYGGSSRWKVLRFFLGDPRLAATIDWLARDKQGNSVLHTLSPSMVTEVLAAFPAVHALVNAKNKEGYTPLTGMLHRWQPGRASLQALVDAGADILERGPGGETVLHYARFETPSALNNENPEADFIWESYLAAGGSIDAVDARGNTPLFNFLSQAGSLADVFNHDLNTLTPSQYRHLIRRRIARALGPDGGFERLFGAADALHRNDDGETALHVVARRPGRPKRGWPFNYYTVELFKMMTTRKGVDALAEDKGHRSSLDVAAVMGHRSILKLFERRKDGSATAAGERRHEAGDTSDSADDSSDYASSIPNESDYYDDSDLDG